MTNMIMGGGSGFGGVFSAQFFNTISISVGYALDGSQSGQGLSSRRQNVMPRGLTLFNMCMQVQVNSRDIDDNLQISVNAILENQTFVIPFGTTGFFQDTVNTDVVVTGDLVQYRWLDGGGVGAVEINSMGMEYTT